MQINFYFELHFTGWQKHSLSQQSQSVRGLPISPGLCLHSKDLKCQGKRGVCHLAWSKHTFLDRVFCFFKISSLSAASVLERQGTQWDCVWSHLCRHLSQWFLCCLLEVVPENKEEGTGSLSPEPTNIFALIKFLLLFLPSNLEESLSSPMRESYIPFLLLSFAPQKGLRLLKHKLREDLHTFSAFCPVISFPWLYSSLMSRETAARLKKEMRKK